MSQFDVFLCYNNKHKELVRQIAEKLKESGLKVWFDDWELTAGNLKEALEEGVRNSRSIVVFIGSSRLTPWQNEEVKLVLENNVSSSSSIIPVIFPVVKTIPELPEFLNKFVKLDFRRKQMTQIDIDELIKAITKRKPKRSIPQMGSEFTLNLTSPHGTGRHFKVYTLPNPNRDELLQLEWETFGLGIEKLKYQIKNYGYDLLVNACFGINDAGLLMATFLNASVMHRVKIGYFKCKRSFEREIVESDSFFPELPSNPIIMLFDFEVKSGNSLEMVFRKICDRYETPKVYFAVFGAMTEKSDLKIKSFDDLKSAAVLSRLGFKDYFIACTMHYPGIEPPLGLR